MVLVNGGSGICEFGLRSDHRFPYAAEKMIRDAGG